MSNTKSAAIKAIKQQQQAQQGKGGATVTATSSTATSTNAASSSTSASSSSASSSSRSARGGGRSSRWSVDLVSDRNSLALTSGVTPLSIVPIGYTNSLVDSREDEKSRSAADEAKQNDLLYKSAMALATAPGKQLMMTAFMLWMSGNSLQIFSIMMLGMALWTPISEIFNIQTKFLRYADSGVDLTLPKLTFIAMNLAGLAVGLYKCNTMSLLPTSSADWIDTGVRTAVQVAGGGII